MGSMDILLIDLDEHGGTWEAAGVDRSRFHLVVRGEGRIVIPPRGRFGALSAPQAHVELQGEVLGHLACASLHREDDLLVDGLQVSGDAVLDGMVYGSFLSPVSVGGNLSCEGVDLCGDLSVNGRLQARRDIAARNIRAGEIVAKGKVTVPAGTLHTARGAQAGLFTVTGGITGPVTGEIAPVETVNLADCPEGIFTVAPRGREASTWLRVLGRGRLVVPDRVWLQGVHAPHADVQVQEVGVLSAVTCASLRVAGGIGMVHSVTVTGDMHVDGWLSSPRAVEVGGDLDVRLHCHVPEIRAGGAVRVGTHLRADRVEARTMAAEHAEMKEILLAEEPEFAPAA